MSKVDHLLTFLLERRSRVGAEMMRIGYSEDQVREAWDEAREAGFAESTGLEQDRLTDAGRSRANELR